MTNQAANNSRRFFLALFLLSFLFSWNVSAKEPERKRYTIRDLDKASFDKHVTEKPWIQKTEAFLTWISWMAFFWIHPSPRVSINTPTLQVETGRNSKIKAQD